MKQARWISDSDLGEVGAKRRLLTAAERLFAEKGYTHTTVLDITGQAQCNVSAVNYYFHGKDELYLEVFRSLLSTLKIEGADMLEQAPMNERGGLDLEGLVDTFAQAFVGSFLKEETGPRLMRLIVKEHEDPHLPRDFFLTEVVQPIRSAMMTNLKRVCPHLDDMRVDMCLQSIVGQLMYLLHTLDASQGVNKMQTAFLDADLAVEHIVAFSAAGIRHFLKQADRG